MLLMPSNEPPHWKKKKKKERNFLFVLFFYFDSLIKTFSFLFLNRTNFREALKTGFFDLQSARDFYRVMVGEEMNAELIFRFLEVQASLLCPIAPHFCEHVWKLLGHKTSIFKAAFPTPGPINDTLLKQNEYIQETLHEFRLKRENFLKPKGKTPPPPPTTAIVTVARTYPELLAKTLILLRPLFEAGKVPEKGQIMKVLATDPAIQSQMKKIMSFVAFVTVKRKKEKDGKEKRFLCFVCFVQTGGVYEEGNFGLQFAVRVRREAVHRVQH
jgi:leucyl-tRNA synthetase